ncbi:hypothetical protein N7457_008447 [Penicillium paradoxum]|uniref:uncharacterized protein n=1 Tax=Penicillium paradoxum TaxID=176176 RepID=UPI002547E5F7|nr:uncharacterized protein N7457_008447 [Penicillium paradoxum]KAJ5773551.1 hypothetical protein N7457_008447 [Penicillium paradoxum]
MFETEASLHSYDGGCHCGKISFTAQLSSPIEEQVVNSCNCSICSINGYLLVYAQKENVTFHNAVDAIKEYRFGTLKYPHAFCPNCGSSVYARGDGGEHDGILALNARALKNVDISTLKIVPLDGKRINID